jgi:hypothetical protein
MAPFLTSKTPEFCLLCGSRSATLVLTGFVALRQLGSVTSGIAAFDSLCFSSRSLASTRQYRLQNMLFNYTRFLLLCILWIDRLENMMFNKHDFYFFASPVSCWLMDCQLTYGLLFLSWSLNSVPGSAQPYSKG